MIIYALYRSKGLIALFSILFSLAIVVGSTYAWQTDKDEKLNRTGEKSGQLAVQIEEDYQPNLDWIPGETTKKELFIKNYGEYSVFVRLSLYDFFACFETDLSSPDATGSLAYVSNSSGQDIDPKNANTWEVGNTYKIDAEKYATVASLYKSDLSSITTAIKYQVSSGHPALDYLSIGYNTEAIFTGTLPSEKNNYWFYDNGYFYYSERLELGEVTQPLLKDVSLSEELSNKYKGALYQLVPKMEAHDASKSLVNDWGLIGTPMEKMYQGKLK